MDSVWIFWICLTVQLLHAASGMRETCIRSKCFHVSGKNLELSWDEARDYCHEQQGHLAAIRNKDEHNLIVKFTGDGDFWIGARLSHKPPPLPPVQPPRQPLKPPRRFRRDDGDDDDDDRPKPGPPPPPPPPPPPASRSQQNCGFVMKMLHSHQETYSEKTCSHLERTLCVYHRAPSDECPIGFDKCGPNLCTRAYADENWYAAKMQCASVGAKLPGSILEQNRPQEEIKNVSKCIAKEHYQFSFWTNYCEPRWEWDAGTDESREVMWWAWAREAPSPALQGCVVLEIDDEQGHWRDDSCIWIKRFICEKDITSSSSHEATEEPKITIQEKKENPGDVDDHGLLITIPIVAVLMIVIITLLVVIVRYRRRKQQEHKDLLSMGSNASYQSSSSFSRDEGISSISHVNNPEYGSNFPSQRDIEIEVLRRQVENYERLERERIMRIRNLPYLPLNMSQEHAAELSRNYLDVPREARDALHGSRSTLASSQAHVYDYIDASFRRPGSRESYLEPIFRRHSPSKRTSRRLISQTSEGYHSDGAGSDTQDRKYLTLLDENGRPSSNSINSAARVDLACSSNSDASWQDDDNEPVYRGDVNEPVYRGDDEPVYRGDDNEPVFRGGDDEPVYRDAAEMAPPRILISTTSGQTSCYDDIDDDPVYRDHSRQDLPDTSGTSRQRANHAPLRRMNAGLANHSQARRSRSADDAVEPSRKYSERRFISRNTEKRPTTGRSKQSNGLSRKRSKNLPSHMRHKTVERTQSEGEVAAPTSSLSEQKSIADPDQSHDSKQNLLVVAV